MAAEPTLLVSEFIAEVASFERGLYDGQFIEITNVSSVTIDVLGLDWATESDSGTLGESALLSPHDSLLLLRSGDMTTNGGLEGVDVGARLGWAGHVEIGYAGTVIHRVEYPGPLGVPSDAGVTFNLDRGHIIDPLGTPDVWCQTPATSGYAYHVNTEHAETSYGTPGAPNVDCP